MAGQVLGELIHNSFENLPKIDIIIPTPLHQQRLKERGFNQSVIIAKAISKFTNIPIDTNILIRHKATLAQSGLTASARKKNIKNAFNVIGDIRNLSIMVIDDIFTTGSTCHAITETLLASQAKSVSIVCAARATNS